MSHYLVFFALLAFCVLSAFSFRATEKNNNIEFFHEEEDNKYRFSAVDEEDEVFIFSDHLTAERFDDDEVGQNQYHYFPYEEEDFSTKCSTTDALNMRAGPSTNQRIILTAPKGATVTKTGTKGVWATVQYNGKSGYMHSDYLRCGGSPAPGPKVGTCSRNQFPQFLQCDPRWAKDSLGSSTICKIGCLMSSVSEALNGLGKTINGQAANPKTLNAWLKTHGGYSGNLFIWGSVAPFGLIFEGKTADHNAIKANVCNAGKIVILAVHNQGHYVLASGVDGNGNYIVKDPGYATKQIYTPGEVNLGAIYRI